MRIEIDYATRTFRDFHTCELERCMLVMKMLIKLFVKNLQMYLYLRYVCRSRVVAANLSFALLVDLCDAIKKRYQIR